MDKGIAISRSLPDTGASLPDWGWEESAPARNDQQNLWKLVTDRMSGRWKYAVPLGMLLAGALAIGGYLSTGPKYESSGIIRVAPRIVPIMHETAETGILPFYTQFVQSQAQLMTSHRVLDRAVQSLDLAELPWESRDEALREIRRSVSARANRQSELISITFEADSARVAQAVVNAVITAYDDLYGSQDSEEVRLKLQTLNTIRSEQRTSLTQVRNEIQQLISSTGYAVHNFSNMIEQKAMLIFQYEVDLRRLEQTLAAELENQPAVEEAAPVVADAEREPSEEQLRQFDPELQRRFQLLEQARWHFDDIRDRFTPAHSGYRDAERVVTLRERQYQEQFTDARLRFLERGDAAFAEFEDVNNVPALRRQIAMLRGELEAQREFTRNMSDLQLRIQELRGREASHEQELNDAVQRIRELEIEAGAIRHGRISVAAMGDRPTAPNRDQRVSRAAMGAAAGMGVGFGVFFLLGSVDRRAYSVQQLSQGTGSPRVLGILPALPTGDGDAERSAVAAHCVHQIRNHIESLTRGIRGTPVLAVTSAYQGDGKTSLTLSLGASYAASGCRTVIVDTDLVGRSLTHHCDMQDLPGLKEYMIAPAGTDGGGRAYAMNNLSIYPVGISDRFGPESLRRSRLEELLNRLREQYEIVLLDTGPFPGSVESLPVVTSADGVIFALWRGRRWNRLHEAVALVREMGGNCLGVVLNHARAADCEQYVSKSSVSAMVMRGEPESRGGSAPGRARPPRLRNALVAAMESNDRSGEEGRGD
jgi:polysaccharide biosynthesis transport protein